MDPIKKPPSCRECGAEMYQDDLDYNFKGNYDVYWNCPDCQTSCIEKIRFGQKYIEDWHSENGDVVKDDIVRFPIKR